MSLNGTFVMQKLMANMLSGLLAAPFMASGCVGTTYAPVSGKVTYNDAPLAGAQVLFQPVGGQGGVAAGVGSFAKTDSEGRFKLEASTATPTAGAVPGRHQVRIALPPAKGAVGQQDSDAANAGGKPVAQATNPVPAEYNEKSTLTFDVPPGGTQSADFALKGPPLPGGR
ncbi:MAG: DUF4198 domain-containing protein [Planctomycetes bacterium]|nr:DUF4198 domain-containing protein [Planctomycetota bacterium]